MTTETIANDELAALNYFMPAEKLVEKIETLRTVYLGVDPATKNCGSNVSDTLTSWWIQSPEGILTVTLIDGVVTVEVFFGQELEDIHAVEVAPDIALFSPLDEQGWQYHSVSAAESFISAFEDITDVFYMPADVLIEYVKQRA